MIRQHRGVAYILIVAWLLLPAVSSGQSLTGALIGTVVDPDGGVLPGAAVHVTSPALIGGAAKVAADRQGHFRFPVLPPGVYVLEVSGEGFATSREENIRVDAGATIERIVGLQLKTLETTVVVQTSGSRIEA